MRAHFASSTAKPRAKSQNSKATIALSSGCLYTYGLARFFELAEAAGAETVEVIIDGRWDTRQAEYLSRLSVQHRLPIVSIHAPFWHVEAMESDYIGCVRATIALAERVGARVMVVHPEWGKQRYLAPRLGRAIDELQRDTAVTLTVENMPFRRLRTQARYPSHTVESMARFRALTVDTAHFGTAEIDLLAAYRALVGRVRHVHLSDYRDGKEHLLPGDGMLPLGAFLRALADDDYQGIVTLELEPEAVHAGRDDAAVVGRLRQSLEFCREHLPGYRVSGVGRQGDVELGATSVPSTGLAPVAPRT